ncbi:hypothetical protein A9Z42_0037560 [Trichoderma parareesei]|uniref:Uncharacterized protein n=1 Tax=Trichoderma parareesei TaxID=858221 RepID=A0A2H2Z741_TRIPA|nr:hypothetical protein A9Z42_0037560 [Trichoderma parareesei]
MTHETLQFAPILQTERLTLTLIDFTKQSDEQTFTTMLKTMVSDLLNITDQEATANAQSSLAFYRFHGRIQPAILRGRIAADQPAIWLVRLAAPHGDCIGVVYVVQRSLMPDQEVLRYFRDDLGVRDLMAVVHPDSPKSPRVAGRLGYVPVEGGIMYEDGVTRLLLYVLPSAKPLPKDMVFRRFGSPE